MLVAVPVADALARAVRVPRLCSYMLIGALAGPSALQLLERTELDPWKPLIDLAIAVLVFDLGTRVRPRWLLENRWLAASSLAEAALAALVVTWTLTWLGASPASAAVAGAVAASTSPVIAMAVTHELRPRGQVGERLLLLSAINSMIALLALKVWPVVTGGGSADWSALLSSALIVICGSFLLGLACGAALDGLSRITPERATMPVLQIALVIVAALLSVALSLSPLMTLLAAGVTARARMGHRLTVEPQLGSAGAVLTVVLFVCLGMLFGTEGAWAALPWALAVIAARALGKGIAVVALARVSALGWRQALALTLALQPMSSLALLLAADSFGWAAALPGVELPVMHALLLATALMQLSGPWWVQFAIERVAGERGG
jgi:Kef-type K+ transport system membrane component KefB